MMRSLYSGVSGLKNHQTRMDIIGNNIANVNTAGFKASRVVFQDIYSQMTQSSSAPSDTTMGGTNSKQIGLGVNLAAIDIVHSSAATQRTDGELDLAIYGDGFFVVRSPEGNLQYTRAGNLYIDVAGNLVNTSGCMMQGLQAIEYLVEKATYNADGSVNTPAKMVQQGTFSYQAPDGTSHVYPDAGSIYDAIITNPSNPDPNELEAYNAIIKDYQTWLSDPANLAEISSANTTHFNADGTLVDPDKYEIVKGVPPTWFDLKSNVVVTEESALYVDRSGQVKNGILHEGNFANINVAGYTGISFDEKGFIKGLDGAGQERVIGVLPLATFTNTGGLEKQGSSLYGVSANSGRPVYNQASQGGSGTVNPGGLEMSNVDLANEFTDMIITQRGYQASSRIITVTDTMLEELINLKR